MPNSFWYAGGDYSTEHAIPASAFSKGDILMLNSSSSISRVPSVASGIHGDDIVGVALADSVQSISNKVPYLVPQPDTLFWASLSTNESSVTPGTECDLFFDATDQNRYYVEPGSANSVKVVIVRGTADVDQSVQSKALVKFIYHDGQIDLS